MLSKVQRIVVAADLGETLPDVLAEAGLVARTFGAELTLVHAIPEAPEGSPDWDAVSGEAEQLLLKVKEEQAREGVKVSGSFRIRAEEPSDSIISTADDLGADLVVLGAGKRTTLERALLGTTAERVLARCHHPVWVARPPRITQLRRILCAIDVSEPSREALATAAFLARTFVSGLTLLSVVPPGSGSGPSPLSAMEREIDLHGIELSRALREGKVEDRIVEVADEVVPDLVVIGSAGRTGLRRLLGGKNTAEKLLRKMPCSLLAVPPVKH